MTKHDKKEIGKMVKHLPQMQSKTRTEKVATRSPMGYYTRPLIINHKTEAEKVFKIEGIEGVKKYCSNILEKYNKAHEQDGAPITN